MCFSVTDSTPFSWWVGGPNGAQVQTYWGGAPQGSRQCSCGLQQNCVDPKHQCNCDADRNEWYWILSSTAFPAFFPFFSIILIISSSPLWLYLPGRVIQACWPIKRHSLSDLWCWGMSIGLTLKASTGWGLFNAMETVSPSSPLVSKKWKEYTYYIYLHINRLFLTFMLSAESIWNAAFFDKETSYLHFPTFHGELSADISFLFKTTSFSGVFLENLGIKDFIRIELSCKS